jgi:hypothetical protein
MLEMMDADGNGRRRRRWSWPELILRASTARGLDRRELDPACSQNTRQLSAWRPRFITWWCGPPSRSQRRGRRARRRRA